MVALLLAYPKEANFEESNEVERPVGSAKGERKDANESAHKIVRDGQDLTSHDQSREDCPRLFRLESVDAPDEDVIAVAVRVRPLSEGHRQRQAPVEDEARHHEPQSVLHRLQIHFHCLAFVHQIPPRSGAEERR